MRSLCFRFFSPYLVLDLMPLKCELRDVIHSLLLVGVRFHLSSLSRAIPSFSISLTAKYLEGFILTIFLSSLLSVSSKYRSHPILDSRLHQESIHITEKGGFVMRKGAIYGFITIFLIVLFGISAWAGWDPMQEQKEKAAVEETIAKFKAADPSMKVFFEKAYGYAVFPGIGKGGFIIGGGHGDGWVYDQGKHIGRASLTQLTVGAQIGGQSYSEIIFFEDKKILDAFKQGNWETSAQASAIIVKSGASKDASYDNGVAIFTMPKAGAMVEASVGGQKFNYTPK